MKSDARSTTHPIQQPIANEAEANSAFDDIAHRKGQAFIRMIESFLGEDIFRDGIRKYMAEHKYSNTHRQSLGRPHESFGKTDCRNRGGLDGAPGLSAGENRARPRQVKLSQERFAVHFQSSPPQSWRIPLPMRFKVTTRRQAF